MTDSTNTDVGLNVSGVGYKQALANGWLLKDSSGNYLKPAAGDFHWFGDIGDPNFQKAWVDNVSTFLIAHHADGVFIDNVLCQFGGLTGGVLPAKYPTDASWADAQVAFLAAIGPAMHAKGLYVSVNAYCYGPDNGSANTAWWTRIAPYVDGELTESFEQNPSNSAQLFFNAPTVSWLGNWLGKLDVIKAAQAAGKAAFALSYAPSTNTAVMTYTKASFLLVWNGTSGGFIFNPTDSADPWNPAWTTAIGAPTGSMTQIGGAYVRDYTGGVRRREPEPVDGERSAARRAEDALRSSRRLVGLARGDHRGDLHEVTSLGSPRPRRRKGRRGLESLHAASRRRGSPSKGG